MENVIIKKLFIEEENLVWEYPAEGIIRSIIAYDESLMLVKVIFEKGAVGSVHHHYHTQISYIEKGIFEVTINDETKMLKAGASFFVPPNVPHGVVCVEAGILIDMFSPMRDDFIID